MSVFRLFFFFDFNTSPHLPELLGRMLQSCSAAKLQKCFVDYKILPDLPSEVWK